MAADRVGSTGRIRREGCAPDGAPRASDSWDSRPNASDSWDVPHLRWERDTNERARPATECPKSLTSIMFHYPGQHNHGGNLLGPDPVDLADIRFVRF